MQASSDSVLTQLADAYEPLPSGDQEGMMVLLLCGYLLTLASLLFFASRKLRLVQRTHAALSTTRSPQTFVFIEGYIGAGKSTFIQFLFGAAMRRSDRLSLVEWKEPVNVWGEMKVDERTSLFCAFYADRRKYAFPFQVYVLLTRLSQYIRLLTDTVPRNGGGNIVVVERSIGTCRLVASVLYQTGHMDELSYQIVASAVDSIQQPANSLTIYIRTDVDLSKTRTEKRSRPGEGDVDVPYLELLHQAHEKTVAPTADLILNGGVDQVGLSDCCERVLDFIEGYHNKRT